MKIISIYLEQEMIRFYYGDTSRPKQVECYRVRGQAGVK